MKISFVNTALLGYILAMFIVKMFRLPTLFLQKIDIFPN